MLIVFLFLPLAHAELENFQAADVVLGQPNFTSNAANNGGVSASSVANPGGIFSSGGKLFTVELANNRVLIWNKIPTINFASADIVLGQPNFSSNGAGLSASAFSSPRDIYSVGTRLFLTEATNNRVLIWNTIPTTNFTPADTVLGQPDFISNAANNGGVSARSISAPRGVFSDGKRLFVADFANNRVLIWNSFPTTSFTPADVVIGQPDFTSNVANSGGLSSRSLSGPLSVFSDGRKLFVADGTNARVLIWNSIPILNFMPANVVIGQPDFVSNAANNGGVSERTLNTTTAVFSDGKRLFVSEFNNRRVLIWNQIPATNFEAADVVLGQPNFNSNTTNNGGVSARSLTGARNVFSDGKRLFVTDFNNHRFLIYNLSGSSHKLDPQFEQGKAVVGKVFNDVNSNGIQDQKEPGIEGVKVVSDTGIYAITDHDGKYHFPYIETGQRVLKLDESTLPEGSTLTTDNPYKATITKGILTKVSFGVRLPESSIEQRAESIGKPSADLPLLEVSITQDTQKPTKTLGITAELKEDKILFTTTCNYYLFIKESMILLYDSNQKPIKTQTLPHPIPLYYELPLKDLKGQSPKNGDSPYILYYQLLVKDAQGHEDRTAPGKIEI